MNGLPDFDFVVTPKLEPIENRTPEMMNAEIDRIAGLFDSLERKLPGQQPSPQCEAWDEIKRYAENFCRTLGVRFEAGPDGHSEGYLAYTVGVMVGVRVIFRHFEAVRASRDKRRREAEERARETVD